MLRTLLCSGCCLLWAILPVSAEEPKSGPWPQFRGPKRDNISPATGLLTEWPGNGPPLAWKREGLGVGYASVSLANGKIYTMGDKNGSAYIHALDPKDGKLAWSAKIGNAGGRAGGSSSTPTV